MALPDLDQLIAEVDRTCATATRDPDGVQPDWGELLTAAAEIAGRLHALADDLVGDYVEHCRLHQYSWTDIGAALGVTRQAAQQRFLAPHREYGPDELSDELRAALAATKRVAVEHRNNYIGTEHLLRGLLAEPGAAGRLLDAVGIARTDLVRATEARLSLGASQAAQRIAFTPYARRAMAVAEEVAEEVAGAQRIGTDHVLVALVRLERGVAAEVLVERGATCDALEGALRSIEIGVGTEGAS